MALRRFFGFSDGELCRSDAKPCSRLMRHTARLYTVGGGLSFWILCRLHYGPRITVPRTLRWIGCGALSYIIWRIMSKLECLAAMIFKGQYTYYVLMGRGS
ncbi:hypothetical protein Sjap_025522 [Stephania japonica]|uniref:DUF7875 domain-containing protein n=1 Tax=Stephania japonica TaxID=461633 RepID=A0AAP0HI08_9MAGN